MPCAGNSETHCCWLEGQECRYVEENTVPGRRWACGLMRRYGSWGAVLASPEYHADVAPILAPWGYTCKDWPAEPAGSVCADCGWGMSDAS